jgi:hypothetical protein
MCEVNKEGCAMLTPFLFSESKYKNEELFGICFL